MWEVMYGGHSEAVQGVHGLLVASVFPVRGLWGVGRSKSSDKGSALSSALWLYAVCMWMRREVLSRSGW